jgi:hypothetical protein
VGERVSVREVGGAEERRGYVTRVVASGMTPISVTELATWTLARIMSLGRETRWTGVSFPGSATRMEERDARCSRQGQHR